MKVNELVTIIVPIYKVEPYLHRCIDSVLNQTYTNLEIILVDDGSPDRCGEICDEYAEIDSRIKVIHKINGGLSDARNSGIDIAQGQYLSFLDSDDWIGEKYVEILYGLLEETNSDISVCNFIRISSEETKANSSKNEIHEFSNIEALEQFADEFYVQMVIAACKLYRTCLFKDIRFPVGRIHEDEFTTYKLLYKAKKIVMTTAELLYYWQREDSIMGSSSSLKQNLDALDSFEERAEFLKEVGLNELSDKTYALEFDLCTLYINQKAASNEIADKKALQERLETIKGNLKKIELSFDLKSLNLEDPSSLALLQDFFSQH